MKGRKLRPDEAELWAKVSENTTPLAGRDLPLDLAEPGSKPIKPPAKPRPVFSQTIRPQGSFPSRPHDLAPSIAAQVAGASVQMDRKAFTKLKRGKLRPEARLDLHGMTLDRAHGALNNFILSAHASGKRLVLVITGKGKAGRDDGPIPMRTGALRHQVPSWLGLSPLNSVVLQVTQAHNSHGGGGAYYVYLRRKR